MKRIEAPAHATRIMYTSRDRTGRSIGVTGTALASTKPWPGPASAP